MPMCKIHHPPFQIRADGEKVAEYRKPSKKRQSSKERERDNGSIQDQRCQPPSPKGSSSPVIQDSLKRHYDTKDRNRVL